jgi:predicted Zn-dependent protease
MPGAALNSSATSHRIPPLRRWFILPTLVVALLVSANVRAQDFSHPDTEPSPQAALAVQANDALSSGDFATALKLLTDLNAKSPNNPQVLYDLGLTLEAMEPASPAAAPTAGPTALTAESCYRRSIDANPAFPPPHIGLGLLLARTNRIVEARTQLTLAITLPDIEPALKARAYRALAKLDQQATPPDLAAATSELLAAVRLTPEQPDDILLSAQIADASADLPAAEQAYRRYLALPAVNGDPQVTAALAHILLAEHRPADAEAILTTALVQHPGDPTFTAQLAQAYLQSGDPTKTIRAAPMLVQLHADHPDDRAITRVLARVYLEADHADQAEALYASLIAGSGDHPDPTLLDARAEALLSLHRPAEAEKLLKQAIANPAGFPTPDAFGDAATRLAFAASEIDDPRTTLQALAIRATVQQPSPSSLFLEATANDDLHQTSKAIALYKQFLVAAGGKFPDQESQARKRLTELQHTK